MHTEKFFVHTSLCSQEPQGTLAGKRLVGVRCDITSAGWVIAESIASNTGSGPIEVLKNEGNCSIICRGSKKT